MIKDLEKEIEKLNIKTETIAHWGRVNLEERGVTIEENASLFEIINKIKEIPQGEGGASIDVSTGIVTLNGAINSQGIVTL
jgi:hypothetical protein